MPTEAQINSALAEIVADGARLQNIVNGDAATDITLADGISTVPSIAKLFSGISNKWRSPAVAATTGALPNAPVYANGTAGQGATLTAAANGALSIDGVALAAGQRVLIKDEAAQSHNGIYAVTNAGSVGAPYVLTRVVDADTNADLVVGMALAIQQGAVYGGATFVMSAPISGSITVGTDAIIFRTQASLLTPTTLAGILLSTNVTINAARSVTPIESGSIYNLTGNAYYKLTFGDPAGFGTNFVAEVFNADTLHAKNVAVFGFADVRLYPGQSVTIKKVGAGWVILNRPGRYLAAVTFYVDPINGKDDDTVDGLATGTGAFKSIDYANGKVTVDIDAGLGGPTIKLADGTYSVGSGVELTYPLVGRHQLAITGNIANPAAVLISCNAGGNCFFARDLSTTTLNGMTLGTSGNGSTGVAVSGQGAVVDLINWAFNAFPLGNHVSVGVWCGVNFLSGGTINGGTTAHITANGVGANINYGSFNVAGAAGLAFTIFAIATGGGSISAGGVAMTFTGFAGVTGQKYSSQVGGKIISAGTVFPGSTAGVADATTFATYS